MKVKSQCAHRRGRIMLPPPDSASNAPLVGQRVPRRGAVDQTEAASGQEALQCAWGKSSNRGDNHRPDRPGENES
jgi:hypothetical protein